MNGAPPSPALAAQFSAEGKGTPMPSVMSATQTGVLELFGFRDGTSRASLLLSLASSMGKQLAQEVLLRVVKGSQKELDNGLRGIRWRCGSDPSNKKGPAPYRLVKEQKDGKTTYGLHPAT